MSILAALAEVCIACISAVEEASDEFDKSQKKDKKDKKDKKEKKEKEQTEIYVPPVETKKRPAPAPPGASKDVTNTVMIVEQPIDPVVSPQIPPKQQDHGNVNNNNKPVVVEQEFSGKPTYQQLTKQFRKARDHTYHVEYGYNPIVLSEQQQSELIGLVKDSSKVAELQTQLDSFLTNPKQYPILPSGSFVSVEQQQQHIVTRPTVGKTTLESFSDPHEHSAEQIKLAKKIAQQLHSNLIQSFPPHQQGKQHDITIGNNFEFVTIRGDNTNLKFYVGQHLEFSLSLEQFKLQFAEALLKHGDEDDGCAVCFYDYELDSTLFANADGSPKDETSTQIKNALQFLSTLNITAYFNELNEFILRDDIPSKHKQSDENRVIEGFSVVPKNLTFAHHCQTNLLCIALQSFNYEAYDIILNTIQKVYSYVDLSILYDVVALKQYTLYYALTNNNEKLSFLTKTDEIPRDFMRNAVDNIDDLQKQYLEHHNTLKQTIATHLKAVLNINYEKYQHINFNHSAQNKKNRDLPFHDVASRKRPKNGVIPYIYRQNLHHYALNAVVLPTNFTTHHNIVNLLGETVQQTLTTLSNAISSNSQQQQQQQEVTYESLYAQDLLNFFNKTQITQCLTAFQCPIFDSDYHKLDALEVAEQWKDELYGHNAKNAYDFIYKYYPQIVPYSNIYHRRSIAYLSMLHLYHATSLSPIKPVDSSLWYEANDQAQYFGINEFIEVKNAAPIITKWLWLVDLLQNYNYTTIIPRTEALVASGLDFKALILGSVDTQSRGNFYELYTVLIHQDIANVGKFLYLLQHYIPDYFIKYVKTQGPECNEYDPNFVYYNRSVVNAEHMVTYHQHYQDNGAHVNVLIQTLIINFCIFAISQGCLQQYMYNRKTDDDGDDVAKKLYTKSNKNQQDNTTIIDKNIIAISPELFQYVHNTMLRHAKWLCPPENDDDDEERKSKLKFDEWYCLNYLYSIDGNDDDSYKKMYKLTESDKSYIEIIIAGLFMPVQFPHTTNRALQLEMKSFKETSAVIVMETEGSSSATTTSYQNNPEYQVKIDIERKDINYDYTIGKSPLLPIAFQFSLFSLHFDTLNLFSTSLRMGEIAKSQPMLIGHIPQLQSILFLHIINTWLCNDNIQMRTPFFWQNDIDDEMAEFFSEFPIKTNVSRSPLIHNGIRSRILKALVLNRLVICTSHENPDKYNGCNIRFAFPLGVLHQMAKTNVLCTPPWHLDSLTSHNIMPFLNPEAALNKKDVFCNDCTTKCDAVDFEQLLLCIPFVPPHEPHKFKVLEKEKDVEKVQNFVMEHLNDFYNLINRTMIHRVVIPMYYIDPRKVWSHVDDVGLYDAFVEWHEKAVERDGDDDDDETGIILRKFDIFHQWGLAMSYKKEDTAVRFDIWKYARQFILDLIDDVQGELENEENEQEDYRYSTFNRHEDDIKCIPINAPINPLQLITHLTPESRIALLIISKLYQQMYIDTPFGTTGDRLLCDKDQDGVENIDFIAPSGGKLIFDDSEPKETQISFGQVWKQVGLDILNAEEQRRTLLLHPVQYTKFAVYKNIYPFLSDTRNLVEWWNNNNDNNCVDVYPDPATRPLGFSAAFLHPLVTTLSRERQRLVNIYPPSYHLVSLQFIFTRLTKDNVIELFDPTKFTAICNGYPEFYRLIDLIFYGFAIPSPHQYQPKYQVYKNRTQYHDDICNIFRRHFRKWFNAIEYENDIKTDVIVMPSIGFYNPSDPYTVTIAGQSNHPRWVTPPADLPESWKQIETIKLTQVKINPTILQNGNDKKWMEHLSDVEKKLLQEDGDDFWKSELPPYSTHLSVQPNIELFERCYEWDITTQCGWLPKHNQNAFYGDDELLKKKQHFLLKHSHFQFDLTKATKNGAPLGNFKVMLYPLKILFSMYNHNDNELNVTRGRILALPQHVSLFAEDGVNIHPFFKTIDCWQKLFILYPQLDPYFILSAFHEDAEPLLFCNSTYELWTDRAVNHLLPYFDLPECNLNDEMKPRITLEYDADY